MLRLGLPDRVVLIPLCLLVLMIQVCEIVLKSNVKKSGTSICLGYHPSQLMADYGN